MNIDLEQADELELMHYKIALMKVIIGCQEQIHEIDAKLEKEKRKRKECTN